MKLKLPILALAIAALVSACSGSGNANPTSSPSVNRHSDAKVHIVTPTNGEVFHSSSVPLKIKLSGAKIIAPTTTHIDPHKGHLHVYLDGQLVSMNYGLSIHPLTKVKPGQHTLEVEFVASDHRPWDPRIIDEVVFVVKR